MGLIICGYPGVGKSSIAGWNNCIDLESSYFSHRNGVNGFVVLLEKINALANIKAKMASVRIHVLVYFGE